MKKRTSSLPLLVIVAVVALVLGSFGTAEAAGLTKKTVKKIATKVVNKKASSLSVASAANAGNATNLNNLPSATYLDRVAFTANPSSVPLPAGSVSTEIVAATPITIPAGVGFIQVTGTSTISGNSAASSWAAVDVDCTDVTTPAFNSRIFTSPGTGEDAVTVNWVQAITPGNHTIRLCARNGAAGGARGNTLTIQTVATGHLGTSALKPSSAKPGADGNPDTVK